MTPYEYAVKRPLENLNTQNHYNNNNSLYPNYNNLDKPTPIYNNNNNYGNRHKSKFHASEAQFLPFSNPNNANPYQNVNQNINTNINN